MPDMPLPPKPPDGFRLIHSADWHLGKLLNDQSREEEHRMFLDWLLSTVKTGNVDAILLAGDVFDSANPPQNALRLYYHFVSRLFRETKCTLAVIAGNHDSPSQLEAPKHALSLLNVVVVGQIPEQPADRLLRLPDGDNPAVVIALIPLLRDRDLRLGNFGEDASEIRTQLVEGIKRHYEETAAAFQENRPHCPLIGTGHLTVAGSTTSDSERDIHIGGLGAFPADAFPDAFSYVALGHLHRPQAAGTGGRIRYSGSPIALGFGEANDAKEIRLLDVSATDITQHAWPIPVFRRLARVRTTPASLEKDLAAFTPGSSTLRPWVEVVVEGTSLDQDLPERVAQACENAPYDVLKVVRDRSPTPALLAAGDADPDDDIGSLLDNPTLVFKKLLEENPDTDAEEKQRLAIAFAGLREILQQPDDNGPPP
jgi:exonuclease SbcD